MFFVLLGMMWLMCAPGASYCEIVVSEVKYTWEEANDFCTTRSARMISSDTAAKLQHNPVTGVVWTSNTIKIFRSPCPAMKPLCKFKFVNDSTSYGEGLALYGECDVPRYYVCKYGDNIQVVLRNGSFDEARVCPYTLLKYSPSLEPGYYWLRQTLFYCTRQSLGVSNGTGQLLRSFCGVYGEGFGQAYVKCSQVQFALCTSPSSVSAHGPSTTTNRFATDSAQSSSEGLGVKIGVPMGVCVVLICGVIVVMAYIRRRRRKHDKRGATNGEIEKTEKGKSKLCNNGMYAMQRLGQSESGQYIDSTVRVDHNNELRQQETNSDYAYLDEKEVRNISKEHMTKRRSGNGSHEVANGSIEYFDNTGYCFAGDNGSGNQTSDACETSDDHVYNYATDDNDQYDNIATKRKQEIKTDNVYNHVPLNTGMDNVYDSTTPGKLRKNPGMNNVYNTLSGDGCDETNAYDFTKLKGDIKGAKAVDNIYNTLDTE